MAYDDFAGGKRAIDTCHFLMGKMGGGVELRSTMWKFDVLRSAKLNQIAVEDAVEADVIIVATTQNGGLPPELQKWIQTWAPLKRGQAAVLVALIDCTGQDTREPDLAAAFLKQAAANAGIDFLAQAIRAEECGSSISSMTPDLSAPLREGDLPPGRPSPEAWGLND
jgi:hypothetical protein